MWGDDLEDYTILVNNQLLRVRKNLHDFLEMARHRMPKRPLWIDAVCINQDDNIEKGYQVQLMGEIFKGATEVLVWLGIQQNLDYVFEFVSNLVQTDVSVPDSTSLLHLTNSEPEGIDYGLRCLCSNPYWSRAWIAQEILLAKHVRIINGSRQAEWRSVIRAVYAVRKLYPNQKIFTSSPMLKFWDEWPWDSNRYQWDERTSIWNLSWVWKSQCMDPRDRIYSLLALLFDNSFKVDYLEDTYSLFWRAGEHFRAWNSKESLKNLSQALNLDAAALEQNARNGIPTLVSLAVVDMRHPDEYDISKKPCEECGTREDLVTGKEISLCIQDPANVKDSQHAILSPTSDGSFTVILRPSYDASIRGLPRNLGPGALRRVIDGQLMEVKALPTREDYICNPDYRIVLPPEVVIENLKAIEAQATELRAIQYSGYLATFSRLLGRIRLN
jgi:hypothetical protein